MRKAGERQTYTPENAFRIGPQRGGDVRLLWEHITIPTNPLMDRRAAVLALLLVLVGLPWLRVPAEAQPQGSLDQPIEAVFVITVDQYRQMSAQQRRMYIVGTLEGITLQEAFASFPNLPARNSMANCILHGQLSAGKGLTFDQAQAIVDRYLEANPKYWNLSMSLIVFSAFAEACK